MREPRVLSRIQSLCQPKVEHLDGAVRTNLDVRRLQIAVDDAPRMRGFDCRHDLARDGQYLFQRQRALWTSPIPPAPMAPATSYGPIRVPAGRGMGASRWEAV